MLLNNPKDCVCGQRPKLLSRSVSLDAPKTCKEKVYSYSCPKCGISTFHTKKEEFCRELWNAAVDFKLRSKD